MFNDFLNHFDNVKQLSNTQYTALCPAHNDKRNSLSIGLSNDGKLILIYCYAGCKCKNILDKAGLKMSDLYINNLKTKEELQVLKQTIYNYYNENGTLVYKKIRKDYIDGKKDFYFQQPDGTPNLNGVQQVLYNLPDVIKSSTIYFVEGEKCADRIIKTGMVATTLTTGANSKWEPTYEKYLKDKEVIIIPDNDMPGYKYAKKILEHLPNAKVVRLPDLSEKGDIYDWLDSGHTMEEISKLPTFDLLEYLSKQVSQPTESTSKKATEKETQTETAIRLVEEKETILFHDTTKIPYAAVVVNSHRELLAIKNTDFKDWINLIYYNETKKILRKENLSQVVDLLSTQAKYNNPLDVTLYNRVGKKENAFWYDLTNPDWQAVKITADGWQIENEIPILFTRYNHQKSQSLPIHNGNIKKILDYINITDEQTLFLCWLVCCFVPDIAHPMPIFYGEQGAAKSTACTLLKGLIDPSTLDTLTIPKSSRSFCLNLQHHWFLPFDNISYISDEVSDSLCKAITGGGIEQRKLFTDAEEYIFVFKRCIALNGINNIATKPDLLDRAILIELSRIQEDKRRELSKIQADFEMDLPLILGGVFDILSKAMQIRPSVNLDRLPRMADFACWGYAVGEALGGYGQKFIDEYSENQKQQNIEALNSDSISTFIITFMYDKTEWYGRMSDLWNELSQVASDMGINTKAKMFPSQPNVLSRRLNGLKSNLQSIGITFETSIKSNATYINIVNEKTSPLPPYHHLKTQNVSNDNNYDMTLTEEDGEEEVIF